MQEIILTGDRPSGKLHLGHYVGSLQSRVQLQTQYKQYVMIADVQALTDNFADPKKIIDSVYDVCADYLSVGIDPDKTTIFIQSQIPEIAELTLYYLNLVNIGRLERNPTVKTEIKQKGFNDSLPVGFLCYPVNQAADITIFKADLVPVGDDQVPMIEQTNEIVRKFNNIYHTNCLHECKVYLSNAPRLVGIDGKTKASKSLNNAIFLTDTKEEVENKVLQMFTDPNHIKISDPGEIVGNAVFAYLDAFYIDKGELEELKAHYKRGGLGDITIKKILIQTLNTLLEPIREKRSTINKNDVIEIMLSGIKEARKQALFTMQEVRAAIGINYFNK